MSCGFHEWSSLLIIVLYCCCTDGGVCGVAAGFRQIVACVVEYIDDVESSRRGLKLFSPGSAESLLKEDLR